MVGRAWNGAPTEPLGKGESAQQRSGQEGAGDASGEDSELGLLPFYFWILAFDLNEIFTQHVRFV